MVPLPRQGKQCQVFAPSVAASALVPIAQVLQDVAGEVTARLLMMGDPGDDEGVGRSFTQLCSTVTLTTISDFPVCFCSSA